MLPVRGCVRRSQESSFWSSTYLFFVEGGGLLRRRKKLKSESSLSSPVSPSSIIHPINIHTDMCG